MQDDPLSVFKYLRRLLIGLCLQRAQKRGSKFAFEQEKIVAGRTL